MARVLQMNSSLPIREAANASGHCCEQVCPRSRKCLRKIWYGGALLVSILCGLFPCHAPAAPDPAEEKPKPARFKISGYGLLGNRQLRRAVKTVELGGTKPRFFGASFVEDTAIILGSRIREDGFLQPRINITLTLANGEKLRVTAEELMDEPLPRPLQISHVHFRITKGRLYYYETLEFEGLGIIPEKQALSWFMVTGPLLQLKRLRIYTPEGFKRGLGSIEDTLARKGYEKAVATAVFFRRDDRTGTVEARIRVEPGRKSVVHSVREEYFYEGRETPDRVEHALVLKPYSRLWEQDYTLALKTNQFHGGYADVTVDLKTTHEQLVGEIIEKNLLATIKSGPRLRIGEVRFQGQKRTRPGFMSRRVRVERGEWLNPIRVEEGRLRLARLGVFDRVNTKFDPVDEHTRHVIYDVKEGKTIELSLLAGWGSYELLRGGFVADLNNIWGLAHHARLKAVQSFKATSGDFTYTIPDFNARDFDLFFNGSGLRREEVSFTREEYGGGVGVHRFFRSFATDVSLRYNYQILNAASIVPAVATEGLTNPAVGSFVAEARLDRRDNPLYPSRGFKIFLTTETATEHVGGEANYERVDASASWHLTLGGGRSISLGLSHGAAISFGSPANNLPFNRRFFPGGANSIRGYQEGEASPRNEAGEIVGAESYMLGTVELEQALTPKWSLVAFADSLGYARRIEDYPFDSGLFSVGGGIRWRTLIGPVRLEYGYNLNPRPRDPSGTIQFSLGFPF